MLAHLGVEFDGMHEASTSDPEAHSLVERVTNAVSAGGVFKMRELVSQRLVSLKLVSTSEMHADILTKILDLPAFRKCRSALMNLEAVGKI